MLKIHNKLGSNDLLKGAEVVGNNRELLDGRIKVLLNKNFLFISVMRKV